MSIIARYLLAEFLLASGAVFLALFTTWIAADTLLHIDDLGQAGAGWQILVRALEAVPIALPIACLAGIVWSLTRAVRHREVTAIRCGGIPLRKVLIPVLLACLALGGALAVFEDRVIVPTHRALVEAENADGTQRSEPTYLNGRWWYASGDSIFSATAYLADRNTLIEVTVFQFDADRNIQQRIEAREAVNLRDHLWDFHQVRVFHFANDQGLRLEEAESLTRDLGLSAQDLSRAGRPAELTSLHKLARRIRRHQGLESTLLELKSAFHSRLSRPLAVLILVAFAMPFALGNTERGDSLPRALVQALAACAAFWLVWTLALLGSRSGLAPPGLMIWSATLLCLAAGLWRFQKVME